MQPNPEIPEIYSETIFEPIMLMKIKTLSRNDKENMLNVTEITINIINLGIKS